MNTKKSIKYIVSGAVIAALYVGLTLFSNIFGLAYGGVQFRISEALCILPVFGTPAIAGLTVGCFIANMASFNWLDLIIGTAATLSASVLTYCLRNLKLHKLPVMSFLSPVIINAVFVGGEIALFFTEGRATLLGFVTSALFIALGETVVLFVLGIPLYFAVKNNGVLFDFFS